jgi:hypothetical protein
MTQFDPKSALYEKLRFFEKNHLGIGPMWRILTEIGQKLDFRAFCSEI